MYDSFEDEFADLGTCVAMYPFDGEYVDVSMPLNLTLLIAV